MVALTSANFASAAFVEARRNGIILADFPGKLPASLDEAYVIQDNAILLSGQHVGGWKVGRIAPELVDAFGADRLCGPIFADQICYAQDGEAVEMPVLPGFAAVEVEILLKIGAVPDRVLTLENAFHFVSEVRLGIEIASSPFPGINKHGPAVTVSDFGNNFGLVVGPQIDDWREIDLMNAPARMEIDGVLQGEGALANMLDGPFGAVAFLDDLLKRRGLSLLEGAWISTGAITGVHGIAAGQDACATFNDCYSLECRTAEFTGFKAEKAL